MKFSQRVILDGREVIVMIHNVESKEEGVALLDKAQPLKARDVKAYTNEKGETNEFIHLNTGLGYTKNIRFTEDDSKAGASTSCTGEWV